VAAAAVVVAAPSVVSQCSCPFARTATTITITRRTRKVRAERQQASKQQMQWHRGSDQLPALPPLRRAQPSSAQLGSAGLRSVSSRSLVTAFDCCAVLCSAVHLLVGVCMSDYSRVTFGSAIKLQHRPSGFRLHSHQIKWGSGSGQQSVTGFEGSATRTDRSRGACTTDVTSCQRYLLTWFCACRCAAALHLLLQC